MSATVCPCGSGNEYAFCCGRYIIGGESAPTAESLMRSRYTAYVNIVNDYLLKTWHPSTRPVTLESALDSKTKWLGLKILDVLDGGVQDVTGEVEFVARYKVQGRAVRLHEHSRFIRERGCWYYLDGQAD